jgi:hypothetical protein
MDQNNSYIYVSLYVLWFLLYSRLIAARHMDNSFNSRKGDTCLLRVLTQWREMFVTQQLILNY